MTTNTTYTPAGVVKEITKMAIPKQYMAYLTTILIVLAVLYIVSHYFKDAEATFGVSYVGTA